MTCFVATSEPLFAKELEALAGLAGFTVVTGSAQLLLLDLDAPAPAPACAKTIRFSRKNDAEADFLRPFSYRALLDAMQSGGEDAYSTQFAVGYTFPSSESFTATEKRLLDVLLKAGGATVTSRELAEAVFADAENQNELKVYIRHLRQKIEEPQGVRVIETVRGVGYRLRSDRIVKRSGGI